MKDSKIDPKLLSFFTWYRTWFEWLELLLTLPPGQDENTSRCFLHAQLFLLSNGTTSPDDRIGSTKPAGCILGRENKQEAHRNSHRYGGHVGYLVILHHALFHKNHNQYTSTSIIQATASYLLLLLLPTRHFMRSNTTTVKNKARREY
jgi:hypothetical protein